MKPRNYLIVNGDTDGIAFKKRDETPFTEAEQEAFLKELNALMPEHIVWKNGSQFRRVIVFKAKNYVLDDGKKVKIKGSALKATKKEPALQDCIKEVINLLLTDKKEQILFVYLKYVNLILSSLDINQWCFKATITKKVLEPETAFNKKIKEALKGSNYNEGDKVYLYFREDKSLSLRENYKFDCDKNVLLGKLRDTFDVFSTVFDTELFPDLTLKRNKALLESLKPKSNTGTELALAISGLKVTRPINADPRLQVR